MSPGVSRRSVVSSVLSRPCHPDATTKGQAHQTAVRRPAVGRRSQQAAHAPTAPWRGRERKARWASSTGWHAEGRVVPRMPPVGAAGAPEPDLGLGRSPHIGSHPRGPTEPPVRWTWELAPGLSPVVLVSLGALTVPCLSGRVFFPPRGLPGPSGNRRKLASGAICPEQSFGPPGTNASGEVRARSLLENGIVRAKSQCGQFIRTHTDGLYVNTKYAGPNPFLGEEPVVTNSSSQTMVTL